MPWMEDKSTGGKRWYAIIKGTNSSREVFNLFCLWDFVFEGQENIGAFVSSGTRITEKDMAQTGQNFNMCMIRSEDKLNTGGNMPLAHEIGHYLEGRIFHFDTGGFLMSKNGGSRMTKRDADVMNP